MYSQWECEGCDKVQLEPNIIPPPVVEAPTVAAPLPPGKNPEQSVNAPNVDPEEVIQYNSFIV